MKIVNWQVVLFVLIISMVVLAGGMPQGYGG